MGEIVDKALTVGDAASTTDLSGYFSDAQGQALSYTATSSMPTVATAAVAEMTLTVTAVVAGTSTITVTATDPDKLTAKQTFTVTVTAAGTTPTPTPTPTPTGDIDISVITAVDLTDYLPTGTAPEGYVLESRDTSVFTVARMGTSKSVWNVSPKSVGSAKAEIVEKADGSVDGSFMVTVENRAPRRATPIVDPMLMDLVGPMTRSVVPPVYNLNNDGNKLNLYKATVPVGTHFKDDDAEHNSALTYTIKSSREDVVIQAGGSCAASPCEVWVDITTRRPKVYEFNLNVIAVDPLKEMSSPLAFPVIIEDPAPQTYLTRQVRKEGAFRTITVGNRSDVNHTLDFDKVDQVAAAHVGFTFATKYLDDLRAAAIPLPSGQSSADGIIAIIAAAGNTKNVWYGVSTPPDLTVTENDVVMVDTASAETATRHAYTVKASGRVLTATNLQVEGTDASDTTTVPSVPIRVVDQPQLLFKISSGGAGTGTIEIGYHVWWDKDGALDKHKPQWHSTKQVLTVTVKPVK